MVVIVVVAFKVFSVAKHLVKITPVQKLGSTVIG